MEHCNRHARMLISQAVHRVAEERSVGLMTDRHIFAAVHREISATFTRTHGRHPLLATCAPTSTAELLQTVDVLMRNRQAPPVTMTTSTAMLHRIERVLKATLRQE